MTHEPEPISIQIEIKTERYRTPDGKPTCAKNFPEGQVCPFFIWGGNPCISDGNCGLIRGTPLIMPYEQPGFMQPHKDCTIWNESY